MNEIQSNTEDGLRSEIAALKRQLEEQKNAHRGQSDRRPSAATLAVLALGLVALIVAGFFVGYLPRQKREQVLAAESKETGVSLPLVNVAHVTRASGKSNLVLPCNVQAVT